MAAERRLQALSKQVVEGIPDAGTFEDIPRIREVAGDPAGPYVPFSCVLSFHYLCIRRDKSQRVP